MFYKKKYMIVIGFLAISGSILTWILLYGDFSKTLPIRAKQVIHMNENQYILRSQENRRLS